VTSLRTTARHPFEEHPKREVLITSHSASLDTLMISSVPAESAERDCDRFSALEPALGAIRIQWPSW
jgi:hypothetical protein